MSKHSSSGGSAHSGGPSSSAGGSAGGGRSSGFTVEPTALDSMSTKLGSLGQQLTGHSSSVGGAHPGSGAFGVVGQALSGRLGGVLSQAQQHIGNIAKSAHGASDKTKFTAQDLRDNEATNSKLFSSIGSHMRRGGPGPTGGGPTNTRSAPGGRSGGSTRAPGGPSGRPSRPSGQGGRYNPYGGRPGGQGPGGQSYRPPAPPPQPPPPPPPAGTNRPPPYFGTGPRPPRVNPNIPQSAHDHVTDGAYNPYKRDQYGNPAPGPVGGHVLGINRPPGKVNPDPAKWGYGVAGGPPAPGTPTHANGVYNNPNAQVIFHQQYGGPMAKPGGSGMFPADMSGTAVQNAANQAWNGGNPSGGFHSTASKWVGNATLPPSPGYPGGRNIWIEGYHNNGTVSTYYPSNWQ